MRPMQGAWAGVGLVTLFTVPGDAFWGARVGRFRSDMRMMSVAAPPKPAVAEQQPLTSEETKKAFERIYATIERSTESPATEVVDEALALAARGRIWSRAMQLLNMENVTPTRDQYHTAILACRNAERKWEPALKLLEEMETRGLEPNATTYNEVMRICSYCSKPKEAVSILDKMVKSDVARTLESYNIAVQALAREKQWKKAVKMIQYMEKQAIWPDTVTYTAAMNACARAGEWQKALFLLEDMVKKTVPPDVNTYNAAMEACRRGGQGERAVAFLEEMMRKKLPVDTRSFTIAISACEENKMLEKALELWDTMQSVGMVSGADTVRALANVMAKKKQWAALRKAVERLTEDGPGVSRSTAALTLAQTMDKAGVKPDVELAKWILQTLLSADRAGDALGLAQNGVGGDVDDDPEIQGLHAMLALREVAKANAPAEGEAQESAAAAEIRERLEGQSADQQWQEISSLCESGQLSEAIDSLLVGSDGAKNTRPPRPSLVKLVLEYCVINKDLDAAKQILRIPGPHAGRGAYNKALRVAVGKGEFQEAAALLKEMRTKEIVPDGETYLELLEGAREVGSLTRVQRYQQQMQQRGLELESSHIVSLMRSYQDFGKSGIVVSLARKSGDKLVGDDPLVATLALEACAGAGLVDDALEIEKQLVAADKLDNHRRALVLTAMAETCMAQEVEGRIRQYAEQGTLDGPAVDALIQAYARNGEADNALSVLAKLEAGEYGADAKATAHSYDLAMQALSSEGRYQDIAGVFDRTKEPTMACYSLAINALSRLGSHQRAVELFTRMVQAGITPSKRLEKTVYNCCRAMGAADALPKLQAAAR